MPHVRDATTRYAFDQHPRSWLALAGLPVPATDAGVTLMDATMSTVSMSADQLVRVDDGVRPYLAHVEFQTVRDLAFNRRMLRYNVWAGDAYGLPVRSVAFLFHRRAAAGVTGRVSDRHDEQSLLEFRYRVVRLWELPVEPLLTGPIGTAPLAVLAAVDTAELPAVVARIRRRAVAELPQANVRDVAEVVSVFLGLRFKRTFDVESIMGSFAELMEQSSTYQATLRKGEARGKAIGEARGQAIGEALGRVEEAQDLILRLGERKFGPPSKAVVRRLRATTDIAPLTTWADRLLTADGWTALLAG